MLGEEHPQTLITRSNVAHHIGNQGRYQEAETEFRAIWEIERRPEVLGEEHPNTLTTRSNLAQQIGNQGRYQEAEKEFRAIWEIWRRPEVLGVEHSHVLRVEFLIAKMLDRQGQEAEADRWLDGLERRMILQVSQDHKHIIDLRAYIKER